MFAMVPRNLRLLLLLNVFIGFQCRRDSALIRICYAFVVKRNGGASSFNQSHQGGRATSVVSKPRTYLGRNLDYEYISEENNHGDASSQLPSSFPSGTPAGLRGEALRAAYRSGRCLMVRWNTHNNNALLLQRSVVQVSGAGATEFLASKLTGAMPVAGTATPSCWCNAKGRLVDVLTVAATSLPSVDEPAYLLLSSPGHASLRELVDQYVFPLDRVSVIDMTGIDNGQLFWATLFASCGSCVERVVNEQILPHLQCTAPPTSDPVSLQGDQICRIEMSGGRLVIVPSRHSMPACSGVAYDVMLCDGQTQQGEALSEFLMSDANADGPVEMGAREYESWRIEAGGLAFGHEMTATSSVKPPGTQDREALKTSLTPPSPLEVHLSSMIDLDKGCFMGQEGLAAVAGNAKGPPRQLWQVVFEHGMNEYGSGDNLTRPPRAGDGLFVLGSSEQIRVGTITSVGEPSGTGESFTLALALVRRSASIVAQVNGMELDLPSATKTGDVGGMIAPPKLDSLDGLEVIVGGTYTVGRLKQVPRLRYAKGQNMFVDDAAMASSVANDDGTGDSPSRTPENSSPSQPQGNETTNETVPSVKTNDAAAAVRKAAKIQQLEQRAAEALARRKAKQQQ